MQELILYTTSACHLCEQAQKLIQPILATYNIKLVLVDIADSDELIERYGIRIPVILLEGQDTDLGWPFDKQALIKYFEKAIIEST